MELRMDLDVLECQETGMAAGIRMALDLTRPKETYQSLLQRVGEALRIPRLELDTFLALAPSPRPESQLSADAESPTHDTPNYSYKLLPSGASSPTLSEQTIMQLWAWLWIIRTR
jgi:MOB kinase activator 1